MVTMTTPSRGAGMGGVNRMLMLVVVVVMMMMPFPQCSEARTVSVASMKITPYLTEVKDPVTGKMTYDGYTKELLDKVGQMIKVNFTIKALTSQFGGKLRNGSWTGLVGEVVEARAELAAAPMTVTLERARVMDFSVPFQHFGAVVVLKRIPLPPISFSERVLFILRPLEDSVWLMALVAYFLTSVILYVICYVNPYEWRQLFADQLATRREAEAFTCLNTFWFLLSTWMWQGFTRAPRSLGARLVVTVWWMFVVVFLLTYTASLTNMLRVGSLQEKDVHIRILSLKDLATEINGGMDVGFVLGGSTDAYLEHSQETHFFRLGRTVKERKTYVKSVEEGIERVRQSYTRSRPFAFVTESALVQHLVRQEPCDLYVVGDVSLAGSYSLGYRVGWELKDSVDLALLALQENGNLRALQEKWFNGPCTAHMLDTGSQESLQEVPFYSVNLGSLSGIMIILAAGVIAGGIVTVLEIVIFRIAEKTPEYEEDKQPNKKGVIKGSNAPSAATGGRSVSSV